MEMYGTITAQLIIFFGVINILRITFLMVGSDMYGLQKAYKDKRRTEKVYPKFSVVIPAHNEENTILHSLTSVLESNYPKDKLQVVVVDDGSSDSTVAILEDFKQRTDWSFTLVSQLNAGKAHALNNALRNFVGGELVMCLDADSSLHPNALLNAAQHFEDPRVVAMSANVKIRRSGTLFNLIQAFEYLICYQMKRAQTVFNIEYIIGGIGSTFRHQTLADIGYYDTDTITEDIDLTMKFIQLGNKNHRVIYGADVVAYTESVLDMSGLIRQRFRWKYGRAQTFFKNINLFFSRDTRSSTFLTWFYLPFAIFSDIAFFLEPFICAFIVYVILAFTDWVTLFSAFLCSRVIYYPECFGRREHSLERTCEARLYCSKYVFFLLSPQLCRVRGAHQDLSQDRWYPK
jgi:cellulose synthase/poly-beta-1,6-N-acetylglucosamine synthase-like glycosyltransferase